MLSREKLFDAPQLKRPLAPKTASLFYTPSADCPGAWPSWSRTVKRRDMMHNLKHNFVMCITCQLGTNCVNAE